MKRLYPYVLMAFTSIHFFACKKTVDYEHIVQNRITSFTVVNIKDTVIYGAIDNIKNNITVYVPYYYSLTVVEPKIAVDEGATLTSPIQPVNVTDDKQTYSVKSSTGEVRTYSLKVIQQNPPGLSLSWPLGNNEGSPNATQVFYGNLRSTSVATLDVTLTQQATNKTFKPDLIGAASTLPVSLDTYILNIGLLPADLDSGYYQVDISFLGNKVRMDKPLHLVYIKPVVLAKSHVVKQGETITVQPAQNTVFVDLKSVFVEVNGKSIELPVVSYNRLSATLKIPDNFPVINDAYGRFEFNFGKWTPVLRSMSITVNPK
ncbi:hypothetical protein [Pedobacter sp. GR22-10]|uniref:hypothetical protein n=1 Tax=Pedobacter sp. GR22-10 TaxID=2994472 RepID=UPI00224631C7|nr:hypothetical protein [Pedobacter sp. GR22-10]MCX2430791.1 hypothetical protein [Pedobacter sp. GR22-10]